MESLLSEALGYAKQGFKVFPLSSLSKIPVKGSNGFKDATTVETTIVEWFTEIEPLGNIGISLQDTDWFVMDIDNHKGDQQGLKSLMELSNGNKLPDDIVATKTPNDGIHFWFKAPKGVEIKQQIGFRDSIDIIKNIIVAPPSRVKCKDGTIRAYEVVSGSLDSLAEPPQWLLKAITSNRQPNKPNGSYTLDFNDTGRTKKYTAILLEEIVQGVEESQRNVWLTRYTGKLLSLGMNPKEAYQFITVVNENFVQPSLSDVEVNKIFKSILKAELNKRKAVVK